MPLQKSKRAFPGGVTDQMGQIFRIALRVRQDLRQDTTECSPTGSKVEWKRQRSDDGKCGGAKVGGTAIFDLLEHREASISDFPGVLRQDLLQEALPRSEMVVQCR